MMSLRGADGIEYLWQGDPAYWSDRAPNLFPFIARLTNNSYTYRGKTYPMTSHGFALLSDFSVAEELSCKSDLLQLPAGQTYETGWTITVI